MRLLGAARMTTPPRGVEADLLAACSLVRHSRPVAEDSLETTEPYRPEVEDALRALDEARLREVLCSLLKGGMRFVEVRINHGPQEKGKDLIAWRSNELVGGRDYYAFVVKAGNLNAQVTSASGIRGVLHQVEQALDFPLANPLNANESFIRECWVVTNGRIPQDVLDDVHHTMRRHHLDRLVRWVDLSTLTRLFSNSKLDQADVDKLLGIGGS